MFIFTHGKKRERERNQYVFNCVNEEIRQARDHLGKIRVMKEQNKEASKRMLIPNQGNVRE